MINIPKLGTSRPLIDCRTLKIADVLKELPAIPDYFTVDEIVGHDIPNPVYANDVIGDCVIAGQAHWMRRANYPDLGELLAVTEAEVKREYYLQCGWSGFCWDDVTKYAESGLVMLTSIKKLRNTGWTAGKALHKIDAFGSVNWQDYTHLKACIYLFNGAYTAVGLPAPASAEFQAGKTWSDLTGAVADWGYHCMDLNGIVRDGNTPLLEFITWGKKQYATVAWAQRYMTEVYALVDHKDNPASPVDTTKLQTYLASLN